MVRDAAVSGSESRRRVLSSALPPLLLVLLLPESLQNSGHAPLLYSGHKPWIVKADLQGMQGDEQREAWRQATARPCTTGTAAAANCGGARLTWA